MNRIRSEQVDSVLRNAVAAAEVPGVVAAVTDSNDTIYQLAAGLAHTAYPRDLRRDDVFRIASMTKIITSIAMMMLHEEGKLSFDVPLTNYLPAYRQPEVLVSFDRNTREYITEPATDAITIRQLLTHTSGYGNWFLHEELRALTHAAPELFDPPFLMYPPTQRFAYSISTDVLGQLTEPLAGLQLDEFLRRRIFAPLGMSDTSFDLPVDRDRLVSVHRRVAHGLIEQTSETQGGPPRGGGGLYSTADDYLKLLRLFLNDGVANGQQLLQPHTVEQMRRNQIGALYAQLQTTAAPEATNDFIYMDGTQKFGFGFMIETRDQALGRAAGSYSWGGILNTFFWVDPRTEIAALILMQVSPFADPVCVDLYRRFERAVYDYVV